MTWVSSPKTSWSGIQDTKYRDRGLECWKQWPSSAPLGVPNFSLESRFIPYNEPPNAGEKRKWEICPEGDVQFEGRESSGKDERID